MFYLLLFAVEGFYFEVKSSRVEVLATAGQESSETQMLVRCGTRQLLVYFHRLFLVLLFLSLVLSAEGTAHSEHAR